MQSFPGYSDLRAIRVEPWGAVYAATQDSVGRAVEIHVVGEHVAPAARLELVRAVRASAAMGLATVSFCVDLDRDGAWFVLERPGKGGLLSHVAALDDVSRRSMAAILLRTWSAVHRSGLLCGSIRPDAVRVRPDGSPCVALCPYLHDATVQGFDADAIPWLPAWITRGEGRYDLRAERAAVATLICALLTGEPAHNAVATLGSSNVPAEAAELLVAIASGASDAPLDAAAAYLGAAQGNGPTAQERHEADVLVASLYDDVVDASGDYEQAPPAAVALVPFETSDYESPAERASTGDRANPDEHSRATFSGELDLAALIEVADLGTADGSANDSDVLDGSRERAEGDFGSELHGEEHEGTPLGLDAGPDNATSDPTGFPTLEIAPAEHLEPEAAERMLARLRRIEEWIHGPHA